MLNLSFLRTTALPARIGRSKTIKIFIGAAVLFTAYLFQACSDDVIIKNDPPPPPSGFSTIDYEPAWSPEGHTIVYYHSDTGASLPGIYLIDTNGANKRQLVSDVFKI